MREIHSRFEVERHARQVEKAVTVRALTSNIAHRLGTPLNVIRARAEHLLRSENNPPKTVQGLETIVAQVDKIAEALMMLVEFGARREVIEDQHDVREIVRSAIMVLEDDAARRGVEVQVELGDVPLPVRCDPDELRQIFLNIETNALEAIGKGGGSLKVLAERRASDGLALVRVIFEDTGPGIAADCKQTLFDPFFAKRNGAPGIGMGLAVSQSIAREIDGEIVIEAGERGARVIVCLPF